MNLMFDLLRTKDVWVEALAFSVVADVAEAEQCHEKTLTDFPYTRGSISPAMEASSKAAEERGGAHCCLLRVEETREVHPCD